MGLRCELSFVCHFWEGLVWEGESRELRLNKTQRRFTTKCFATQMSISPPDSDNRSSWRYWDADCVRKHVLFMSRSWTRGHSKITIIRTLPWLKTPRPDAKSGKTSGVIKQPTPQCVLNLASPTRRHHKSKMNSRTLKGFSTH